LRVVFPAVLVLVFACNKADDRIKILGNIEEPQNQIAVTIAHILNQHLPDTVFVSIGKGSLANLDSLEAGKADLGIVDNYARFSDRVSSIMPLYPQVLHILYKEELQPKSFHDLVLNGKIFAGLEGSGTFRFVELLLHDLGISKDKCQFVDVYDYFEADVIFAFTDLLTFEELRDLEGYKLFSIDTIENLGKGSLAESISIRHPQFEPYIIPRDLYGKFNDIPVLTVKVEALLVCRADLESELVYKIIQTLSENSQTIKDINPLLYEFSSDFDPRKLTFSLHLAARDYLDRHEPSFLERYAEMFGVIVSVFVALASSIYTITQWREKRRKNKIDIYYSKLLGYRKQIGENLKIEQLQQIEIELKLLLETTLDLVAREKIAADESFLIFLDVSKIVMKEVEDKINRFSFKVLTKLN
jgi:TRAP-type uncharacterized transport system substrate-binding protein